MAGKKTVAFGLYTAYGGVENAVEAFRSAGFRSADISILMPENVGSKDLFTTKASKAPEGAAAGAASGVAVGGTLAWLAAIGVFTIPGAGPFLAAGPIMAALAGAGTVGAVGGVAGALIGLGIPEYEANRYAKRIRSGGTLVSVHCDDSEWAKRAKELLERTCATDISATGETSGDYASVDRAFSRKDTGGDF